MSRWEAYTNYNDKAESMLIKMFFWRFFISTILPLLKSSKVIWVNNNLEGYDDFTPNWYLIEGTNILMGMYARVVIIIFVFLYRYYYYKLIRALDQSFSGDSKRTKMVTHKNYITVYKNMIFDVYLSYAEIMNVIFMAFTLGFILPHIFIPSLMMLVLIFYKDKVLSKKNIFIFFSFDYIQGEISLRPYAV